MEMLFRALVWVRLGRLRLSERFFCRRRAQVEKQPARSTMTGRGLFQRSQPVRRLPVLFSCRNRFSATANSVEIPPLHVAETKRTAMKTEAPSPRLPPTLQMY